MLVINTREFRDRQKSYLDKVDEGVEVLIRRAKNTIPVTEDDTVLSKEEYYARLEQSFRNIKEGKTKRYTMEELRIKMGL